MKPSLVILAAGIGSRYGGLKQLDAVGPSGETILEYSIFDAIRAGFGKVVFVIRKSFEEDFREVFFSRLNSRIPVEGVLQEIERIPPGFSIPAGRNKPWGTGHAILMAAEKIREPFVVINADDFYGRSAFQAVASFFSGWNPSKQNEWCMVGYNLGNTLSEHGFVSRGVCRTDSDGFLSDIVERTKIERSLDGIIYRDEKSNPVSIPEDSVVSMNFWGFTPSLFDWIDKGFNEFLAKHSSDPKSEFYIPSVISGLIQKRIASVKVLACEEKWFGVTYREDRDRVVGRLKRLADEGVYPQKLWDSQV